MGGIQALAQCEDYLNGLGVIKEAMHDTAGAALRIQQEGLVNTAAVASVRAAELYDLEVFHTNSIQSQNMMARFTLTWSPWG